MRRCLQYSEALLSGLGCKLDQAWQHGVRVRPPPAASGCMQQHAQVDECTCFSLVSVSSSCCKRLPCQKGGSSCHTHMLLPALWHSLWAQQDLPKNIQ